MACALMVLLQHWIGTGCTAASRLFRYECTGCCHFPVCHGLLHLRGTATFSTRVSSNDNDYKLESTVM